MKLYMKQHVFSWGDKFSVYDYDGSPVYSAKGEIFTFGKKLHLYDSRDCEVAFVEQELLTWMPRYHVSRNGNRIATVVKRFTMFRQSYDVEGLGWSVEGDWSSHEFEISDGQGVIVRVFREWFTLGDAYAIEISSRVAPELALAVALVLDAVISDQRN